MPHITISIDGPTASGKTTLASSLAQFFGLAFLDTGLTFRSLAYALSREPDGQARATLISDLRHLPAVYGPSGELIRSHAVFFQEKEITEDIWDSSLDDHLKRVSRDPDLRQEILRVHRDIVEDCGDVVVVGRDVAVTLLPRADLQIYLTAGLAVRRERRRAQYRDRVDRSTAVGPPTAHDEENRVAVRALPHPLDIDSTHLPASAVFASALNRLGRHPVHLGERRDET